MKKVLSIVLSLVMVLCMVPTMAFAAENYSDIEGTTCEASVELLSELGVVDGYEDGTYKPEGVVTRAEMAKLIITALGLNPTSSTTNFTDMQGEDEAWARPFVGYAESLGIILGYGDGTFGPDDPVTYDQSITMIVRALGYTEACNEMQGQWPAVFVLKARELGILENIATTGDEGANRGDIAIMLANALYVPMVYANNEGNTVQRTDGDDDEVTMMDVLLKAAEKNYGIVGETEVSDALRNITGLLGAAGQIVTNEDGEVITVADIKSTFMTGKFNAAGDTFTADGVEYNVPGDVLKALNGTIDKDLAEDKVVDALAVPYFENGQDKGSKLFADIITTVGTDKVTIACQTSGKSVTAIFSVQKWTISDDGAAKVDEADIADITENQELLNYKFVTDVNGEINEDVLILEGVDSLEDIAEDDVVYVYAKSNDDITKVQVSNETVTGVISKLNGDKYTIDGTVYELVESKYIGNIDNAEPGHEVELSLGYDGKIYELELIDGSAGNFAVVVSAENKPEDGAPTSGDFGKTKKIKLMTADGATVYTVIGKYADNVEDAESTTWTAIQAGDIVKYTLNDSSEITKLIKMVDPDVTDLNEDYKILEIEGKSLIEDAKITAKGYVDKYAIADNAIIFAAPLNDAENDFECSKSDELAVVSKDDVLDTEADLLKAVIDLNNGKIVAMIISDEITSESQYGIATALYQVVDDKGVDFYLGSELLEGILSGKEPAVSNDKGEANSIVTQLYKITKTASGDYTFEATTDHTSYSAISADDFDETSVTSSNVKMENLGFSADMADDMIVYVYDKSDNEFTIGTKSDMRKDGIEKMTVYVNKKDSSENKGLIDFVVIYRQ